MDSFKIGRAAGCLDRPADAGRISIVGWTDFRRTLDTRPASAGNGILYNNSPLTRLIAWDCVKNPK